MTRAEAEERLFTIVRKAEPRLCYDPEFLRAVLEAARMIHEGRYEEAFSWQLRSYC